MKRTSRAGPAQPSFLDMGTNQDELRLGCLFGRMKPVFDDGRWKGNSSSPPSFVPLSPLSPLSLTCLTLVECGKYRTSLMKVIIICLPYLRKGRRLV